MFDWLKRKKIKLFCPRCMFHFTITFNKDDIVEPYEYEGTYASKKLARTLCHSCKTELLIILREDRYIWDPKYMALDIKFEREKENFRKERVSMYGKIIESHSDDIDLINQKLEKAHTEYAEWEKETKQKLGYQSTLPEYPKYRDAIIFSFVVIILIVLVGGGYLLTKNKLKNGVSLVKETVCKYYRIISKKDIKKDWLNSSVYERKKQIASKQNKEQFNKINSALNKPIIINQNNELPPLMIAARDGDSDAIKYLLAEGAKVNEKTILDYTALIIASLNGQTVAVKTLLSAGADVNVRCDGGKTSLMFAAQNGHTDIVEVLLDNGANINTKNDDGISALMFAQRRGYKNTVQLLGEAGAK